MRPRRTKHRDRSRAPGRDFWRHNASARAPARGRSGSASLAIPELELEELVAELSLMPRVVPQVEFVRHAAWPHFERHGFGVQCAASLRPRVHKPEPRRAALSPPLSLLSGARGASALPPCHCAGEGAKLGHGGSMSADDPAPGACHATAQRAHATGGGRPRSPVKGIHPASHLTSSARSKSRDFKVIHRS